MTPGAVLLWKKSTEEPKMGWNLLGILYLTAAALCAVGFWRYVYFVSAGYGFAVAGLGIAVAVIFRGRMQVVNCLQCLLFLAYGARLSGFLLYREIKNASYRKTLAGEAVPEAAVSAGKRTATWLGVSALYAAQVSPVFYRLYNEAPDTLLPWIGTAVSAAALCAETLADRQKSVQKAADPGMPATKGLYRFVRCPNYFGEVLFWTGVMAGGVTALRGWGQWILAAAGYLCIIGIMISGARRLEKRQDSRYGALPAYRAYAEKTPLLLPFVPPRRLSGEKKP